MSLCQVSHFKFPLPPPEFRLPRLRYAAPDDQAMAYGCTRSKVLDVVCIATGGAAEEDDLSISILLMLTMRSAGTGSLGQPGQVAFSNSRSD